MMDIELDVTCCLGAEDDDVVDVVDGDDDDEEEEEEEEEPGNDCDDCLPWSRRTRSSTDSTNS